MSDSKEWFDRLKYESIILPWFLNIFHEIGLVR